MRLGRGVMRPQLLIQPDGPDGAFETMMAKLLSQNPSVLCMRWSSARVECKSLRDSPEDSKLSQAL